MGIRPSDKHSLERKDNSAGYAPGNCIWATTEVQGNNRRDNVVIEHDGKKMTVSQWARSIGLKPHTLAYRLRSGWSIEDALSKPLVPDRWIEFNGERKTVKEWANQLGLSPTTLQKRLALGWSDEQTLSMTVKPGVPLRKRATDGDSG
jgi:hypothetical protein